MKKFFLIFAIVGLSFCFSTVKASNNALEGQLVRQTLLSKDVKAILLENESGEPLPVRIVYKEDALNTFQCFDPTQENIVVVKSVNLNVEDDVLIANVILNVNGKQNISKVFVKNGVKTPWLLSVK